MSMKTRGRITATVSAILLAVFLFAGQVFAQDLLYVDLEVTYDQTTAREMLDLVNEFRLSDEAFYLNPDNTTTTSVVGELGKLTYDYNLEGVAMQRAYEIALNFRHQRPDGGNIFTIDYNGKRSSGENIACGSGTKMDTYEKAYLAFKEDDKDYDGQGHRRNMLGEGWEAVGMAHIVVGNVHYWVQEFSGSVSDNNDYVEPAQDTRTIEDIPWDVDNHTLVSFLDSTSTGNYYTAYYGQTFDLPAVNVWYTANPDNAMKKNVTVSGTTYSFITGYLYGGPVPEERYTVSWESADDTIITTDGDTYTVVGNGLCQLTCTVTSEDQTSTCYMIVNAKKMPLTNENITITMEEGPFYYTGAPVKPEITVMYGDMPLQEGTDYKLKYSNYVDAGNASVQVYAPAGNLHYSGQVKFDYHIIGTSIDDGELDIPQTEYVYTGGNIVPDMTVALSDGTVLGPGDYSVSYSDNKNVGTCTVTVTGKGAYEGTLTGEFTIIPRQLGNGDITIADIPDSYYTGSAITPELTIFYGDIELEPGTDYTVSFEDNIEPGEATANITFTGNYDGEASCTFNIFLRTGIGDAELDITPDEFTYTGEENVPDITVTMQDGTVLDPNTDYDVSYSDNVNAGTCTVTVTGKGAYEDTLTGEITIIPRQLGNGDITIADIPDSYYTGSAITPELTLFYGDIELEPGTDYTVSFEDNIEPGEATANITFTGNYDGEASCTFNIIHRTGIEDGELEITPDEFTYSGDANVPDITVTMPDGTVLDPNTDYDVSYSDNVNAGTCTVTVTGKGAYDGTLTGEFTIVPKHLDKEEIYVSGIPDQVYTGSAITPELTIYYGDIELEKDVDYTVSFEDNTEPGDAAVIVTLTGNYDGETTDTFSIVKKLAEDLTVSDIPDQFYTGKVLTPAVEVYDGSVKLTEGEDYVVTYRNSTAVGTATVIIDFTGSRYSGTVEKTFNIVADAGWKSNAKGWWYINEDGSYPVSTWQKIGGKWYYFKSNGYMATGWQKISGKWYYLNSSGSMATGWKKVDGKWYYLNSNGIMATGWKQVDGSWYYLNSDGSMATGWKKLGGKWYYLKQNGAMVVGAYVIDGKQYKFDSSGAMI